MTKPNSPIIALALCVLAARDIPTIGTPSPRSLQIVGLAPDAPKGAATGTCWGRTITPAIIETVHR